jgi:hypothetical protein
MHEHDERTVILAVSVKLPKHQLRMRTTNPSDCVSGGLVQPRIVAAGRNGLRDTVLSSREAQPKAQSGATTSEWGGHGPKRRLWSIFQFSRPIQ